MSTVYVAEKPSVARDIARVLSASVKRDGYLETRDGEHVVTWAFGHLVRYAEPDEYGAAWSGKWSLGQLPMVPETWLLRVPKEAGKQFAVIKRLLSGASRVVCATDAGREGEHIFRLICEHAGCRKPVQRLWVSSLTEEALNDGLNNLLPGKAFDPLALAAQARAKADWLVGMNLTRACTVRHGPLLSVGRVQTPTLSLIVHRDQAIEAFKPSTYHEVVAHLEPGFDATFAKPDEPGEDGKAQWVRRIDSRQEADKILKSVRERAAVVDSVESRTVRHRPPSLYDLTSLQRDANERFGWSAAETLEAAQALYEARLITYPRTESRHLPEDMRPLLGNLLEALRNPYAAAALEYLKEGEGKIPGKAHIDSTRLTDHHVIIPTKETPSSLSPENRQALLYGLIVSRFVSIFFPDQVVEEKALRLDLNGHVFLASGKRQVEAGWRVVDPPRQQEEGEIPARDLPDLVKGQNVVVTSLEIVDKETTPPRRYSDSTLLSAMKNAGRTLEDDGKAEALKESGGLGTPATRAAVIEALIKRSYVIRKGKTLVSTEKGRALTRAAPGALLSPELTASWEQQLKDIEDGRGTAAGFLDGITGFVSELLREVRVSTTEVPSGVNGAGKSSRALGQCPACGEDVIETGKVYGCSAWRKTGCTFKVWKVKSGKKLPAAQVRALLRNGHTASIKGFKSRDGMPFSAELKLNAENEVVFDFGDREGRA